ncbi:hypothetical protein V6N12_021009 [Hibiscus sabdariffa]|uniref:Uncharacterized protein n=1 Tax=Hibiscus sabdariffa TaxID=183260 RepID=A0ABR2B235_9ROSI
MKDSQGQRQSASYQIIIEVCSAYQSSTFTTKVTIHCCPFANLTSLTSIYASQLHWQLSNRASALTYVFMHRATISRGFFLRIYATKGSFLEGFDSYIFQESFKQQFYWKLLRELGQLSNLEIITLGYNAFVGEIPEEFGNLTNLQCLVLAVETCFMTEYGYTRR